MRVPFTGGALAKSQEPLRGLEGPRFTAVANVALGRRVACLAALVLTACAGAAGSSRTEDKARRDVPIAICRKALNTNDTNEGGAPRVEAYWNVIFPSFRGFASPFASTSRDCVGESILMTDKAAPPVALTLGPSDWTSAPSEDGLEAIWLRASPPEERSSGALAIVRARPAELDVYAIGFYRGSARHSRFEFARMGSATPLVVHDDGCADAPAGTAGANECVSNLVVYMVAGGQLRVAVKTPSEHVQYSSMKDLGRVQWRLTAERPLFDARTMRIKEKLSLRDSRDDEVRKVEGERVFTLRGDDLVANVETLWSQVPKP